VLEAGVRRLLLVLLLSASAALARAATLEDLPPGAELRVRSVTIEGASVFPASTIAAEILTRPRAWYTPWRSRPILEPETFEKDLERIRRYYEARGYFETRITYELEVEENLVDVVIRIEENEPVPVAEVEAGVKSPIELPLPDTLSLTRGEVFNEEDYQKSEAELLRFFLERSYAHVDVERSAEIDLSKREARVRYLVTPGPSAMFGESRVEGNEGVESYVILREIEWQPQERFTLQPIDDTREQLLATKLFAAVRIGWEKTGEPDVVPMTIEVKEKPPREIKIGIGYSTEEQARAQLSWAHYNWLGGGRQLSFSAKYSFIESSVQALFVQPHFPTRKTRGVLEFRQDTEDEETYFLYATRFRPRFEHRFSRTVTGTLGMRAEWAKVDDIDEETEAVLGPQLEEGFLLGPALALIWNTTTAPLNPKDGFVLSLNTDYIGIGGDYGFYRVIGQAKRYQPIGWETILAAKLKIGVAEAVGGDQNFPLFERFYAGGEKSVRGYGRRRLGPLSAADEPLGGKSLIEGSIEARRPIWGNLGGALFVDFGQVDLDAFEVPIGDLEYSAGPGISYDTPVGPLRLDVGFPFTPPSGDPFFTVHFSIGAFF
jgi:outer membrane protein insertion porin family